MGQYIEVLTGRHGPLQIIKPGEGGKRNRSSEKTVLCGTRKTIRLGCGAFVLQRFWLMKKPGFRTLLGLVFAALIEGQQLQLPELWCHAESDRHSG